MYTISVFSLRITSEGNAYGEQQQEIDSVPDAKSYIW